LLGPDTLQIETVHISDDGTSVCQIAPGFNSAVIPCNLAAYNSSGSYFASLAVHNTAQDLTPTQVSMRFTCNISDSQNAAPHHYLANPAYPSLRTYAITPDVPQGLTFDASSGTISGATISSGRHRRGISFCGIRRKS
ncbi:MAG: hypothetical protein ACO1SX_04590, partial [Actinomycetota bacterium]